MVRWMEVDIGGNCSKELTRFGAEALHSGLDEVDDTVADWEASTFAGEFLGVRRRRSLSCLAKGKKVTSNI